MLRRNFILASLFSLVGCRCSARQQLKIGDKVNIKDTKIQGELVEFPSKYDGDSLWLYYNKKDTNKLVKIKSEIDYGSYIYKSYIYCAIEFIERV